MGRTYAQDTPGLDVGVLGLEGLDELGQLSSDALRGVLLEEGSQVALLLGSVRRVPVKLALL